MTINSNYVCTLRSQNSLNVSLMIGIIFYQTKIIANNIYTYFVTIGKINRNYCARPEIIIYYAH